MSEETAAERQLDLELSFPEPEHAPDVSGVARFLADPPVSDFVDMLARQAVRTEAVRERLRSPMFWRSQDGMLWEIATMHPRHALNAAKLLMRNAKHWHDGECAELTLTGMTSPFADSDHFDDAQHALFTTPPNEWLEAQPCYQALMRRARQVGPDAPAPRF